MFVYAIPLLLIMGLVAIFIIPIYWVYRHWTCWRLGHCWHYDSDSLVGEWIRCGRCNKLDEYVPGAHEPKGYHHA